MRSFKVLIRELRGFLILWLTQSFSALGSAMTNFALIVWSYQAQGSALTTALLSVCSYAPYVVMSIFAGALSDCEYSCRMRNPERQGLKDLKRLEMA